MKHVTYKMPLSRPDTSGFVKNLLCLLNLLFGVSGIALIIVGTILEVKSQEYFRYLHSLSYASAPVLFISLGIFVLVIACLGCCGTYRDNYCLIMTYATLLIVVFVVVLSAAIGAFAFESHALVILDISMKRTFAKYDSSPKFKQSWDHLQRKFRCCGVNGSIDYEARKWKIPDSCCMKKMKKKGKKEEGCKLYEDGCAGRIFDEVKDNITIIGSVCFAMAIIQLIGIIFACFFGNAIKKQFYDT